MLHRRELHGKQLLATLLVASVAALLLSCGTDNVSKSNVSKESPYPLVLDGDKLGVSSLDGNPPVAVSEPGFVNGVEYGSDGALRYALQSGREPGFYRVDEGVARLVIPLPHIEPYLPAYWSPDGTQAAWTEPEADGNTLKVAADGVEPRDIGPKGMGQFLWSPDGKQIAVWEGWSATSFYVVDVESGDYRNLDIDGFPGAWTPSGDLIVWEKSADGLRRNVVRVHPDGSGRIELGSMIVPGEGIPATAFSPDGQWVAWQNSVAKMDGSETATLECGEPCHGYTWADLHSWSPDSKQIAWTQATYVLIADVGDWKGRIIAEGYAPVWSPDGTKLTYVANDSQGHQSLRVRTLADGTEMEVESMSLASFWADEIAWSPDGRQLAVPLPVEEKATIFSLDVASGGLETLPISMSVEGTAFLTKDGEGVVFFAPPKDWQVTRFNGPTYSLPNQGCASCFDQSNDGLRFLYSDASGLYSFDGSNQQKVSLVDKSADSARWSPDQTKVAFSSNQTLSVLDIESGNVTVLASGLRGSQAYQYTNASYAWSPDSQSIVFANWHPGASTADAGTSTASLIGADGKGLRELAELPGYPDRLTFSPDGKHVADKESAWPSAPGGLTVLNVATGEVELQLPEALNESYWVDDSSLVIADFVGLNLAHLDGSKELLIASARACWERPIGSSDGKVYFLEACAHQGV